MPVIPVTWEAENLLAGRLLGLDRANAALLSVLAD
jgi:hypothetical protein